MARKITDVTLKQGVLNISNRIASDIGSIAAGLARQRRQQLQQDRMLANQLLRGVEPAKNVHKLIKIPASSEFNNAIETVVSGANSGNPDWVVNANKKIYETSANISSLSAISDNLKAADDIFTDNNMWIRPDARELKNRMDASTSWNSDFMQKMVKEPLPGVFDYNSGQVITTALGAERIDMNKTFRDIYGNIKATEAPRPISVGQGKMMTKKMVPLTNADANAFRLEGGLDADVTIPTIESATDNNLMENPGFVEQYIDYKKLNVKDPLDLTPEEKAMVKSSLLKEGEKFVNLAYESIGGVNVYTGDGGIVDKPYGPSLNFTAIETTIAVSGKNVKKQSPMFAVVRPKQEEFGIPNFRGAINREGNPYSGSKKKGNLTGLAIKPYRIDPKDKKDHGMFTDQDLKEATGFKIYYELDEGDLYVPLRSIGNLAFSMGSKSEVNVEQTTIDELTGMAKKMNSYHKRVKSGNIKDPEMYKMYNQYNNGDITVDEFSEFMLNFKFDK